MNFNVGDFIYFLKNYEIRKEKIKETYFIFGIQHIITEIGDNIFESEAFKQEKDVVLHTFKKIPSMKYVSTLKKMYEKHILLPERIKKLNA